MALNFAVALACISFVAGFFVAITTTTIDRKTLEAQLRKKWGVKP